MDTMWPPTLAGAGRAKYKALAEGIRGAIRDGHLGEGAKLPPVRDLAFKVGVTPGTVARAYSILTDEGVLTAEVGRGTFVASHAAPVAEDWPEIVSLRSPSLPDGGQVALLRELMRKQAEDMPLDHLMSYPLRCHDLPLREALAARLSQEALGPIAPEDMVITHGGQNGLVSIMQAVLGGPDPVVLVERLAYPGFRRAAELTRARVIGIDTDDEGPLPDQIEAAARDHGARMLLTSADVNNPTLRRTSARRRLEIAEVARRHGIHVVDDDCYTLRQLEEEGYRAILPELGWYLSSFSKVLTPALRLGYVAAPEGGAKALARAAAFSHFGIARPLADLGARVLTDPRLPGIRAAVQAKYAHRVRLAVNHLGAYDLSWSEDVPFLWLRLPYGWRSSSFVRAAQDRGVILKSSEGFALRDGRAPHAVRLAVNGQVAQGCYEAALVKLRALLDNPVEEMTV
ncbi:PLP-dependent aminotransferase family protein [Aliiroseovarius sp.]|uniref:aminotransferase-like domain-containing protein n=1 Tax=Aliiroseovarius sp. TaxID=1872442 RepID=UPI0026286F71|nr:PLP-dependent aminotransferase family protein [Aliiroseovarius sp.]